MESVKQIEAVRRKMEGEAVPSREGMQSMNRAKGGAKSRSCSVHARSLASGSAQLRPPGDFFEQPLYGAEKEEAK